MLVEKPCLHTAPINVKKHRADGMANNTVYDQFFQRFNVGNQLYIPFLASYSPIPGFAATIWGMQISIISSMVPWNLKAPFSKQ